MLLWVAFPGGGTGVWRRAQQAASGRAQQPPAACPLPYPRMSFEQVRGGERPYLFGAQPANCTSCRRGFNVTSLTADDHDYCEFWSQVRRELPLRTTEIARQSRSHCQDLTGSCRTI